MVAPLPGREGDVDDERLSWWIGPGSLTNVVPGSIGCETCHSWVPLSCGAGERKNLHPMAFWLGLEWPRPAVACHRRPRLGRRAALVRAGAAGGQAPEQFTCIDERANARPEQSLADMLLYVKCSPRPNSDDEGPSCRQGSSCEPGSIPVWHTAIPGCPTHAECACSPPAAPQPMAQPAPRR